MSMINIVLMDLDILQQTREEEEKENDKTEMQHFMSCRLGDSCARCQRFTKGFNQ